MEDKCPRKIKGQVCGGELVKTNGPSYWCKQCGKKTSFSLRARLRNGELVELLKLPKGGVDALRSLLHTNPAAPFQTVRHGTIFATDLDPASLSERS